MESRYEYYSPIVWIVHLMISFVLFFYLFIIYGIDYGNQWASVIAKIALGTMIYNIIILLKRGKRGNSFEIWFIILSYLFMFGRIFIVGLLKIDTIVALGYQRPIFDSRYDATLMYHSSIFILACIQMFSLFISYKESYDIEPTCEYDGRLFNTSAFMLLIGVPCHLYYSIQMILMAQLYGSYDAIVDQSGLIDDFANFMIYGIICLIFSYRFTKTRIRIILLTTIAYLVVVMSLTGDRRYQVVAIIVLLLAYAKGYGSRFSLKNLWIIIAAYFLLNLFYVLREIRTSNLVGLKEFFDVYSRALFSSDNNILIQTLYEFGSSLYTVCLALRYVPAALAYKYGATFLTGIISIIPFGFIYNNSSLFQYGRAAAQLTRMGSTTVGGSIYGDLFSNFGFAGGIICAGIIGLFFSKIFNRHHIEENINYYYVKYYILFYALIHLARASIGEVVRTATWGLILLYFLYRSSWNKYTNT